MHEYGPVHAAEHREKFESCVIWGQSGYMERQCMESKGIEAYISLSFWREIKLSFYVPGSSTCLVDKCDIRELKGSVDLCSFWWNQS
jgi:hypothetical protein